MTRLQTSLLGQRTKLSRTSSGDLILSRYLGVDDEIVESRTSGAIIERFARVVRKREKKLERIKLLEIDMINIIFIS